ncbi:MAG: zinc ribbon domain-containing protein [Chloroflexota bacterium]
MPDTDAQRCLACGAPLNAPLQGGKTKCPYCGTVNVVGPREKKKGDEIICPECGAINPQKAQHCGRCGIKLEFNCPKCGALNSYGTAFCVQCGIDIQGELQRLEEERRREQEAIRRQQEEARRRQEEIQRRLEEDKKKKKRRNRISSLVAAGICVIGLLCLLGVTISRLYSTKLSPAAIHTQTAAVQQQTVLAIQRTATAKYNTLFHDDFSDPNSGWESYENDNGSAGYESGGYRLNVVTANWLIWDTLPDIFQNDIRIEVDATKIDGPDDNGFGVICRFQDNSNYYYLGISNDGYAAIYKSIQGTLSVISSEDGKWQKVDGIYPGSANNHIRADCVGNTLTLYANGAQIATATDDSFTGGQVSLAAGTFEMGGVDILFDNFFVYRP